MWNGGPGFNPHGLHIWHITFNMLINILTPIGIFDGMVSPIGHGIWFKLLAHARMSEVRFLLNPTILILRPTWPSRRCHVAPYDWSTWQPIIGHLSPIVPFQLSCMIYHIINLPAMWHHVGSPRQHIYGMYECSTCHPSSISLFDLFDQIFYWS
jgi:hypothetical protein